VRYEDDEYEEEWEYGDFEPSPRSGPLAREVVYGLYVAVMAAFLLWLLLEAAHHPLLHHALFAGL
jgi:hypothetical protein